MATLNKKNFDNPDETMTPPKTRVDNVDLGNGLNVLSLQLKLIVVKKHILVFV